MVNSEQVGFEMEVISRQEAKARGLKYYFTGKACKHGHVAERLVISALCNVCKKDYMKEYQHRQEVKSKRNDRQKEYRKAKKIKPKRNNFINKSKKIGKRFVMFSKFPGRKIKSRISLSEVGFYKEKLAEFDCTFLKIDDFSSFLELPRKLRVTKITELRKSAENGCEIAMKSLIVIGSICHKPYERKLNGTRR